MNNRNPNAINNIKILKHIYHTFRNPCNNSSLLSYTQLCGTIFIDRKVACS